MIFGRHEVCLETLRKFDRPGPRYTSYPTAVEFHEGVDEQAYRRHLAVADAAGPEAHLSLYVHLPFCQRRCRFCGCHAVATPHEEVANSYLAYLKQEIDRVAEHLPRRRRVIQMHWGGGTPTYFRPAQLAELFGHIERHFTFEEGAEIALEVDPRVTTLEQLDILTELGFNRLSMGVQDFSPAVQEAIGRGQKFEQTRDLLAYARQVGFTDGINLDLVYGLPRQSLKSFTAGLEQALALHPDRLAVYSFAYVPSIKSNQRLLNPADFPSPEEKLNLYLAALYRFLEAGYEPIGMDHFALPHDELAVAAQEGQLARNFMGYTVKPASTMIAFGISGIGDLESGYFQNFEKLSTYYAALDAGRLPIKRGCLLDDDDQRRRYVITQLMCNFRVDKRKVTEHYGIDFDDYFASSLVHLAELEKEGFVENNSEAVTVVGSGRLFVRNVAMAFDRYREAKLTEKPTFSRTV